MTAQTGFLRDQAIPGADESHALDPQVRTLLESPAARSLPFYASLGAAAARQAYRESRLLLQASPVAMAEVTDILAPAACGPLRLRLYKPLSFKGEPLAGPVPCLVYFHGGGFVLGDLESHDRLCRSLAQQGQCALVAVDYRLAPEHRFPAAADDAIAAVHWVRSQAGKLGLDGERVAVGGDSAGGTLAAVAAIALRGQEVPLALQLLLYPITDMGHELPSHHRLAEGYGLTRESLLWFRAQYLPDLAMASDWRASPLRAADHAGLAPACVITAGFDPLLDEGRMYADRLLGSGVAVTYECFFGVVHGFMLMTAHVAAGRHAIQRAGQALRTAFGNLPPHRSPPSRGPST